jgi:hypothetical protein
MEPQYGNYEHPSPLYLHRKAGCLKYSKVQASQILLSTKMDAYSTLSRGQ